VPGGRLSAGRVTPGQHAASLVASMVSCSHRCADWRRSARTAPPRGRPGYRRCSCSGGESFQPPGALPADRRGVQPDRDAGDGTGTHKAWAATRTSETAACPPVKADPASARSCPSPPGQPRASTRVHEPGNRAGQIAGHNQQRPRQGYVTSARCGPTHPGTHVK
jgi:hypothetical protein